MARKELHKDKTCPFMGEKCIDKKCALWQGDPKIPYADASGGSCSLRDITGWLQIVQANLAEQIEMFKKHAGDE